MLVPLRAKAAVRMIMSNSVSRLEDCLSVGRV